MQKLRGASVNGAALLVVALFLISAATGRRGGHGGSATGGMGVVLDRLPRAVLGVLVGTALG